MHDLSLSTESIITAKKYHVPAMNHKFTFGTFFYCQWNVMVIRKEFQRTWCSVIRPACVLEMCYLAAFLCLFQIHITTVNIAQYSVVKHIPKYYDINQFCLLRNSLNQEYLRTLCNKSSQKCMWTLKNILSKITLPLKLK